MLIRFLVVVLSVSQLQAQKLYPANPQEAGMSAEHLARIDGVVEAAIERQEIPGAVVLVARRARVVYRKAFGYRSLVPHKEPMTVDTIFDMASLTKVMATATSMMILVEEGEVALTDPVAQYLPSFAKYDKQPITILQLLTHYSGLRPDLDLDQSWEGYKTAIEKALDEQLVAPPGQEFIYSDINYVIAGEIIREVSGKPLHEFSSERIYKPLGMTKTGFLPSDEVRAHVAPTEERNGKMLRGTVHDPTAFRMGGWAGHAGLFSTVGDTAIYAQMILSEGQYSGVRILSPLSVLTMTTPQSPPGAEDWRGIGFDIRSQFSASRGDLFPVGSFGHTGFTGTSVWTDPFNQLFVIFLTSRLHPSGAGDVTSLRKKVASIVAASMIDVPPLREQYYRLTR